MRAEINRGYSFPLFQIFGLWLITRGFYSKKSSFKNTMTKKPPSKILPLFPLFQIFGLWLITQVSYSKKSSFKNTMTKKSPPTKASPLDLLSVFQLDVENLYW